MKICIVGLGSIGKRHLVNIHEICKMRGIDLEVHALRKGNRPLPEDLKLLVNKQLLDITELDSEYDAIYITNPTNLHYLFLKDLIPYSKKFFIEKPVFEHAEYDLDSLCMPTDGIYYVACPLRFTSVVMYLKEYVSKNTVYSARAICSSYLPDWRPSQDYTKTYSASKEQGGGVCIDLIHEWDYITYLFGLPTELKLFYGKLSHLQITSEDLAVYIAKYEDKLVELHLDYFGRMPKRCIELFTKEQTLTGDILGSRILFSEGGETVTFSELPNDKYLREMEYFFDLCQGKLQNINDIKTALTTIKLAQGQIICKDV